MKKLFFVLPILAVSFFAFAAPANYGVSVVDDGSTLDGSYKIEARNSISASDRNLIVENVRNIYGLDGQGDIDVQMRAVGRFTERVFIANIRIMSQLDHFIMRDKSTATLTAEETKVVDIVKKYAQ